MMMTVIRHTDPEILVVPYSAYILHKLVYRLRETDRAECRAVTKDSVFDAVGAAARESHLAYYVMIDGQPEIIYGIRDMGYAQGCPWMLATDAGVTGIRDEFLVAAPKMLERLCLGYHRVFNYTLADYAWSHKWIKALGFTMGEPEKLGRSGEMMVRFWKGLEDGDSQIRFNRFPEKE